MPWWQYEPEKKYPFVPAETDPAIDRAGAAGTLTLLACVAAVGFAIAGLLFQAWAVATWGMLGSVAVAVLGGWLLPASRKGRSTAR
jgi:hypothetical protein